MLKSRLEWTAVFIIAALLGTAWIFMSQKSVTSSEAITLTEAPHVGQLAPDFTLMTTQGESVTLSEIVDRNSVQGVPVVLNFWASWCGPCRVEFPHFQSASLKYNGKAAFIGVNQGESAATVTNFGTEFSITYPLLVDQDNDVSQTYLVNSLPTTIFIDANGVVREVQIGIITQAVLEDRIENMLAEVNN